MTRRHGFLFLALLALGGGCQQSPIATTVRDGDPSLFASEVQPVITAHCGFLGCHGQEGMPLTLYALNYQRQRDPDGLINPARPTLDERALSQDELDRNRRAFAARVGSATPDKDIERFVLRLLAPQDGGIPHAGVVVFDRDDEPEILAIRRFLQTVQ